MRDSLIATLLLLGIVATAAGCGSGSGSGLTTGALFSEKPAEPTAPKPISASDRALQVAATTARAQRCGYYFEPEQLRAAYLASEQQAGLPPEQIAKITKEFDYSRSTVASTVAQDSNYCTEGRARDIKASLTRHLAGDFNPPQARQVAGGGMFDTMNQGKSR